MRSSFSSESQKKVEFVLFDRKKCGLLTGILKTKSVMGVLKIPVFWKSRSLWNLLPITEWLCFLCGSMPPTLLFLMVKTAGLYLVPIKSYSKNREVPSILKRIVVHFQIEMLYTGFLITGVPSRFKMSRTPAISKIHSAVHLLKKIRVYFIHFNN